MKKILVFMLCMLSCVTAMANDVQPVEDITENTETVASDIENNKSVAPKFDYYKAAADAVNFPGNGTNLTLEQALEIMLKDHPSIKQMELELEQARISSDTAEDIAFKGLQTFWTRRRDSADFLSNVTQVESLGKFGLESAERNRLMLINSLKTDLTTAYYNILNAQEAYDITVESLDIANKTYETTQDKYQLGMASKYDVSKSESACITAQADVLSAANKIKAARMNLNIKLGLSVTANFNLTDKLETGEYEVKPINEAIELAFNNRNEIKAAEFNAAYQDAELVIAKKKYSSNTHVLAYRTQEVNTTKAHFDLENAKKNIEMEVRLKSLAVSEAQQKYELMKKNDILADEELRMSQVSYEAGLITFQDLERSMLDNKLAKLSLAAIKLDYNIAIMNFEHCMGVGTGYIG